MAKIIQILLVSLLIAALTEGFNVKRAGNAKRRTRIPRSDFEKFTGEEDEFDGAEVPNLIEGDILVKPNQQRSSGYFYNYRWPNNTLVWDWGYAYTASEKNVITGAMQLIMDKTDNCINFRQKQSGDTDAYWVNIIKDNGCYSYVGRVISGAQPLSLGSGCVYTGTAVHEFMHALGYNHEQTRYDRDDHVTVYYENIRVGNEGNFNKRSADYYGTSYDYYSIMHYGSYAFSSNGLPTIVPRDSNVGVLLNSYQKSYDQILTDLDVQGLKTRYGCIAPPTTTAAPITTAAPTTSAAATTSANSVTTTKRVKGNRQKNRG